MQVHVFLVRPEAIAGLDPERIVDDHLHAEEGSDAVVPLPEALWPCDSAILLHFFAEAVATLRGTSPGLEQLAAMLVDFADDLRVTTTAASQATLFFSADADRVRRASAALAARLDADRAALAEAEVDDDEIVGRHLVAFYDQWYGMLVYAAERRCAVVGFQA